MSSTKHRILYTYFLPRLTYVITNIIKRFKNLKKLNYLKNFNFLIQLKLFNDCLCINVLDNKDSLKITFPILHKNLTKAP